MSEWQAAPIDARPEQVLSQEDADSVMLFLSKEHAEWLQGRIVAYMRYTFSHTLGLDKDEIQVYLKSVNDNTGIAFLLMKKGNILKLETHYIRRTLNGVELDDGISIEAGNLVLQALKKCRGINRTYRISLVLTPEDARKYVPPPYATSITGEAWDYVVHTYKADDTQFGQMILFRFAGDKLASYKVVEHSTLQ